MIAACIQVGSPHAAPPPYSAPVADFIPTDETIPNYTSVAFTDLSTGNPTSWSWTINGVQFATTNGANYYFAYTGDYVIRLTVTNSYGSSHKESTITVSNGGIIP